MRKIAVAAGLLALFSVASFAQSVRMRVNVPFQFRAGSQVLSAGQYDLTVDAASWRMAISSVAGTGRVWIPVLTRLAGTIPNHSMLVFHRYGNVYFLREIWTAAEPRGQEIPPSKAEIEMARAGTGAQVARVPAGQPGGGH